MKSLVSLKGSNLQNFNRTVTENLTNLSIKSINPIKTHLNGNGLLNRKIRVLLKIAQTPVEWGDKR